MLNGVSGVMATLRAISEAEPTGQQHRSVAEHGDSQAGNASGAQEGVELDGELGRGGAGLHFGHLALLWQWSVARTAQRSDCE